MTCRFYRYKQGQDFPQHYDNTTRKSPNHMSFFSILIYLTDTEPGMGGETAFYVPTADGHGGCEVKVEPKAGSAVLFFHEGPLSPFHAGLPLQPGSADKYVLRTDLMYQATPALPASSTIGWRISPPYVDQGYTHTPCEPQASLQNIGCPIGGGFVIVYKGIKN